jgi:hypothetical protein
MIDEMTDEMIDGMTEEMTDETTDLIGDVMIEEMIEEMIAGMTVAMIDVMVTASEDEGLEMKTEDGNLSAQEAKMMVGRSQSDAKKKPIAPKKIFALSKVSARDRDRSPCLGLLRERRSARLLALVPVLVLAPNQRQVRLAITRTPRRRSGKMQCAKKF